MIRKRRSHRVPAPDKPYDCFCQLKVHLLHISPQIYRRVLVKGDTTILQLHYIVQLVMGWQNHAVTAGTCIISAFSATVAAAAIMALIILEQDSSWAFLKLPA